MESKKEEMGNRIEKGKSKVNRLERALGKESLNTLEKLHQYFQL